VWFAGERADLAVARRAIQAYVVAARGELIDDRRGNAGLGADTAWIGGVRVERAWKMGGLDSGRIERFLQVHAEINDVQEKLQRPLVLLIAAVRAEGEPWLAVAERQ